MLRKGKQTSPHPVFKISLEIIVVQTVGIFFSCYKEKAIHLGFSEPLYSL